MTYCLVQRRIQKRVKHLRWSFCKNSRKYVHCGKSIHTQSFSVPCFPVFSPNTGKYGPEKLRIWTLFTHSELRNIYVEKQNADTWFYMVLLHIKSELLKQVNSLLFFSSSFDQSLNPVLQKYPWWRLNIVSLSFWRVSMLIISLKV